MKRYCLETLTIARRVLLEMRRARSRLLFWVVFPSLMLLLFGLIYAGDEAPAKSFNAVAPGILVGAALFFSCLGGPVSVIVGERERMTLRRLLYSPLRPVSYFSGIVLAHCVVGLGQGLVVYGIAWAFGGRFQGSWMLGLLILLFCVCSYVGLGFFFGAGMATRTEDVNGPIAAFGVPLLVLGGTFFPVEILPPFLLKLAHLDPIFHMNEALRPVSALGASWLEVSDHLYVLFGFSLLSMVLGTRAYKVLLMREKRS